MRVTTSQYVVPFVIGTGASIVIVGIGVQTVVDTVRVVPLTTPELNSVPLGDPPLSACIETLTLSVEAPLIDDTPISTEPIVPPCVATNDCSYRCGLPPVSPKPETATSVAVVTISLSA